MILKSGRMMPINDNHKKQAELLQQAQAQVTQNSCLENLRQAADTFNIYLNIGADAPRRNEMIINSVSEAITNYRAQLFHQTLQLFPENDGVLDCNKQQLLALVGDDNKFSNINNELIQELRQTKIVSSAQSLLLHQLATLNDMLSELQGIKEAGLGNQNNLFKLLELLNNLDNSVKFVVEVGIKDPDSYRVFQLLNHFAYASFTAALWQNLVEVHNLDRSVEELIELIIASIKPKEHGDVHSEQLTYDSFEQLRDKFVQGAADWFVQNGEYIKSGSKKFSQHLLPIFLGIRADKAELYKLNVFICELLDLEEELGFTVNIAMFEPYLDICFSKQEQQNEKEKLCQKISHYMDYARGLRDTSREPNVDVNIVEENKIERNKLLRIITQTKALRRTELDNLHFLNSEEQKVFSNFIQVASPEIFDEVMVKLQTSRSVTPDFLEDIKKVVTRDKIEDLASVFTKIALRKIGTVENTRIDFYSKVIKQAREQLKIIDREFIQYLDIVNDHAQSLLLVSHADDFMLKDGDHYSSLVSRVLNPSEYALSKYMPSDVVHRLRIIDKLNQSVTRFEKLYAECLNTVDDVNRNSRDNYRVKQAIERIKDTLKSLKSKRVNFERASLLFTLKTLEEIIARQETQHQQYNKELQANNKISDVERKEREKSDFAKIAKLKSKIKDLKEVFVSETFVNLAVTDKQQKLKEIIAEMKLVETSDLSSNENFDFSAIYDGFDRTLNSYSDNVEIRLSALKLDTEIAVEYISNKGWMPWLLEKVKSLVNIYNILQTILNIIVNIFKFIINIVIFPFAETFKLINRQRALNYELIEQIKALSDSIDEILNAKEHEKEFDGIKNLNITDKEKDQLQNLKSKLKDLDNKVGRFSYTFKEVRWENDNSYEGIDLAFKKIKDSIVTRDTIATSKAPEILITEPAVITELVITPAVTVSSLGSIASVGSLSVEHSDNEASGSDNDSQSSPTSQQTSSLSRTLSVDSLTESDTEFFKDFIQEIIKNSNDDVTETIRRAAHKEFFKQLPAIMEKKRNNVLDKNPQHSDNIVASCNKIDAAINSIITQVTASDEEKNIEIDKLLFEYDELAVSTERQKSSLGCGSSIVYAGRRFIGTLWVNPTLRQAVTDVVLQKAVGNISGTDQVKITGAIISSTASAVKLFAAEQPAVTVKAGVALAATGVAGVATGIAVAATGAVHCVTQASAAAYSNILQGCTRFIRNNEVSVAESSETDSELDVILDSHQFGANL